MTLVAPTIRKIPMLLLPLLFAGCVHHPVPSHRTFAGSAMVEGLGTLSFPPGSWALEYGGRDLSSEYSWGDYFVFKRTDVPLHRVTVFRIPRTNAAPQISNYLDSMIESLGDGIPLQVRGASKEHTESCYPLRYEPRPTGNDRHLEYSFMAKMRSGRSWLAHAALSQDLAGWTFILLYTSTEVTSPELVQELEA